MAKIQRKSAKLFAELANAGIGGVSQFGSLAAGSANYSKDPDIIQALAAYKQGWSAAVTGKKSPAIEDRNALDYLLSYQQAYIMQRGVPEWLSTETYYIGSFCSLDNGRMYVSKTDNNIGNDPSTDSTETNWIAFPTPQELRDGLALKVDKAGDVITGNIYQLKDGVQYRLLNASDVHIVDTYINGTSWYRVWSDGWCEQGGLSDNIPTSTGLTINLLVRMADANYSIYAGVIPNSSSAHDGRIFAINRTESSFELDWTNVNFTDKSWWQVKGYSA